MQLNVEISFLNIVQSTSIVTRELTFRRSTVSKLILIPQAMLDVVDKLPIITNQLTILTKSIKKGQYGEHGTKI